MTENEAINAIHNGKLVQCEKDQWPALRAAVHTKAGFWADHGEGLRASIALSEIKRLDEKFKD
jgi:hypothetical protein